MKYFCNVVLLLCIVFSVIVLNENAAAQDCDKATKLEFINKISHDSTEQLPPEGTILPECKDLILNDISCSLSNGLVAVYPTAPSIPEFYQVTLCGNAADVTVQDKQEMYTTVENATTQQLLQLATHEMCPPDPNNPVFMWVSGSGAGTGDLVVQIYCSQPDPPQQVADLGIDLETTELDPTLYYKNGQAIAALWWLNVTNHENNSLASDSPGTVVTVDLPRGFAFEEILSLRVSTYFDWSRNGNRLTIDLGTLPKGKIEGLLIKGKATKYCSRDPLLAAVTGSLHDPDEKNNSYSETAEQPIKYMLMERVLEYFPEYCQGSYGAGFIELLLLKKGE